MKILNIEEIFLFHEGPLQEGITSPFYTFLYGQHIFFLRRLRRKKYIICNILFSSFYMKKYQNEDATRIEYFTRYHIFDKSGIKSEVRYSFFSGPYLNYTGWQEEHRRAYFFLHRCIFFLTIFFCYKLTASTRCWDAILRAIKFYIVF